MHRAPILLIAASMALAQPRAFRVRPNAPPVPDALWETGTRRVRAIGVESPRFGRAAAKAFASAKKRFPGYSEPMELDLFDDTAVGVAWTRVHQQPGTGDFVWEGSLRDAPDGHAVLIAGEDGSLTGNISKGDGRMFQIRTSEDGVVWAREIDQSQFGDEHAPVTEAAEPADGVTTDGPVAEMAGAAVIDVMVLYTAAARTAAGGSAAMQRLIQLGVAETNQGYRNSGVVQQIRLVHSAEIRYTEAASMDTDLSRLISPRDGFLDDAHQLRARYGADLVSLWTEGKNDVCGIAQLMQNATRADASRAFSVVSRKCATGYYSFGHELGHNMGAMHAREDNTGAGIFNFSYGFKQPGKFRTVMAYDGSCRCPRINVWSTTAYTVNGLAAGGLQAQNHTTLNRTAPVVASFMGARRDEPGADPLPESEHPYADDLDKTWSYSIPGAGSLAVTFDAKTSLEDGYDFIVITDAAGKPVSSRPYSGTSVAGRTIAVNGPTVNIRLLTDESITDYGFRVTAVQAR